jgi:membrane protein YqaA with SNARE-associated domain
MKRLRWNIAAFAWGFAEGTLFFIVPDVILSWIGLKHGVRDAALASLIAAIGAACGGVIMYLWSAHDPASAYQTVLALPAISEAMGAGARRAMETQGWFVATFEGPLTSTPYKVYAVLAPQVSAPLPAFALASIAARLPRFLVVSIGVALIGRGLRRWLNERQLLWLLAGAWLLFYTAFFARMPN